MRVSPANRLAGLAGFVLFASSVAHAAPGPVTFNQGGGTYTYNTSSGADINHAITTGNAGFVDEAPLGLGTAFYYSLPHSTTGTVSYVFDAAPGEVFTTASVTDRFDLYNLGTIAGTYTTNLNSSPITFETDTNTTGFPGATTDHPYQTTPLLLVAGASEFTIQYQLTNTTTDNYIQLFRSDTASDTSHPFKVVATSTPEPASLSVLGFGSLALLARRRRV